MAHVEGDIVELLSHYGPLVVVDVQTYAMQYNAAVCSVDAP